MSLLDKIKNKSKKAAREFEKAGLRTNLDIQFVTREELLELFPGAENFQLRRTIFGIINEQKPVDAVIRELKAFIPHEIFRAAVTGNGVFVDYLHILKDMKTQMNNVQAFLDAHIGLLEEFSKYPPDQALCQTSTPEPCNQLMPCNASNADQEQGKPDIGTSSASGPLLLQSNQTGIETPSASGSSHQYFIQTATVQYRSVACCGTLGVPDQMMQKMKNQCQGQVQIVECQEDYWITVVFCPVTSRVGSDAQSALSNVTDDKPVILVLMYHRHQPMCVPEMRELSSFQNVVLCVNVFYHEKCGLLTCAQNDAAVSNIQSKLLEYSKTSRHPNTTRNDPCAPAESSNTSNAHNWWNFSIINRSSFR
uniref:uncharacterized protein LOC124051018 isoform X2 n=1 Tax=Scatophagus argus TaxID=75038 RepID=UPI001ED85072|nr:uncharacterized protein LOC124051018 isoform X2 [Scatophagus argus]